MARPELPSNLTASELLTSQFYEWEERGRGWLLWNRPVELEPPFAPFAPRAVMNSSRSAADDGQHHTLFSSLVERLKGLRQDREREAEESPLNSVEPRPAPAARIAELHLAPPKDLDVTREASEQLLISLPKSSHALAFEIIGQAQSITVQLACTSPDAPAAGRQAKAFFPELTVTDQTGFLDAAWKRGGEHSVILDFGLSQEFMLPLRTASSFQVDPLLGILGAMSDLADGDVVVLQVLFQAAHRPWTESVLRAVLDPEGDSFFIDAPDFARLAREKVGRPLFASVVRIAARTDEEDRTWDIVRSVAGTLHTFADPTRNELIPLSNDDYEDSDHEEDLLARRSRRSGMLLNVEELVSLVHVPAATVRVPKLKRQARKTKAAPRLAGGHKLVLGTNVHAGATTAVTLSPEQRSRHMYLIGASGTGKSTMLLNLIAQDLENGEGLAVLDPHGDLVDAILGRIPEDRIDDVVLFDPGDADFPVGFNILSAHSELEKTLVSSDLIGIFRRLSETWGDQMHSVFANGIMAFLESDQGGTLADLRRFLVDGAYRKEFLGTITDPDTVYFWEKEFPLLSGRPHAPLLTRLDVFLRPKPIRNMVAQRENRVDFARIMNEGKILLAKLSLGAIGEENAYLLGMLLVAKIQQIAMSRQAMDEASRRPFYLYVDEFHNFVTPSMAQILSGARKYRLGLVLAHQDLQQLASRDADVMSAVISNPYTRVCFRVGDQDAKTLEKGFTGFDRTDLQSLGTGEAIVRMERAEFDFNLDTPRARTVDGMRAERWRAEVIVRSRAKYASRRQDVEATLRATMPRASSAPDVLEPTEQAVLPLSSDSVAAPRSPRVRPVPPASTKLPPDIPTVSTPGRGGGQHKYLQELIRRWAEAHGWGAVIEEGILDGLGIVDVALRKGGVAVACEIAVASSAAREIDNIQKCLAGGFAHVISLSSERQVLAKIRALGESTVEEEQWKRVHTCTPEEAFGVLEMITAEAVSGERTVRGYRVRARYRAIDEHTKRDKRQVVSRVIAKALSRLGSRD